MRRYIQKEIIELLETILEGIDYVGSIESSMDSSLVVLQDCFLAIESIENSIIRNLSKDRALFYIEIISDVKLSIMKIERSLSISEINYKQIKLNKDKIKLKIKYLGKEMGKESEVKLEIVFMPYKASMWDSLESIWKAANDDDCCECYVVPIPYCDRNSDVNLIKAHYEGDQFPNDVPITHYKNYDLSIRQPDIIYIHNPFDECNYVTSVHPKYYSYELKKYTDILVYVPYYITGEKVPEAQKILPVFNYMDKMIVQCDAHKKFYDNIIKSEKVVALGSPKVDKIYYYEKNKPSIPSEWENIIQNRKVIMYNISISSILSERIDAINKIKYVFSIFKDRNDAVLLWRPHPLIEATLKSMAPNLLEEYLGLKETFIRENIGIYDDTPDITASISISSGYIGEDSSSIVHMFGVTGKPILILDSKIDKVPTEEDLKSVSFIDGYFEENNMWFVSSGIDALCKMNLDTGKINIVKEISDKVFSADMPQYCDVKKIDNKIYLLPFLSEDICIYDLEEDRLKKITIPNSEIVNFDRMIHYKDSLFMKPKNYSAIIQYNINNGELIYHKKCIEEFYKISGDKPMFLWGVSVRDNLLLIASAINNKVLEFNMDTGKSKVYTVGKEGMTYFAMVYDGNDYWLAPEEGNTIIRWNYESGRVKEYNNYPENFIGENRGFIGLILCGHYILAFPREANMIVRIDIDTGKMSEFKLKLSEEEGKCNSCCNFNLSNYNFVKKINENYIVAFSNYYNSLLKINILTGEYSLIKCEFSKSDVNEYLNKAIDNNKLSSNLPSATMESKYLTIDKFIDKYIIKESKIFTECANENTYGTYNCGVKVHKYIKEQFVNERK